MTRLLILITGLVLVTALAPARASVLVPNPFGEKVDQSADWFAAEGASAYIVRTTRSLLHFDGRTLEQHDLLSDRQLELVKQLERYCGFPNWFVDAKKRQIVLYDWQEDNGDAATGHDCTLPEALSKPLTLWDGWTFVADQAYSPQGSDESSFQPKEFVVFTDGKIARRTDTHLSYRDRELAARFIVYPSSAAEPSSDPGERDHRKGEALLLDDAAATNDPVTGIRRIDYTDGNVLAQLKPAWQSRAPRLVPNIGHRAPVVCAALAADRHLALLWHADDVLRLWNLQDPLNPRVLATFIVPNETTGYQEGIDSVSLSPNGRFAAFGIGGAEVGYLALYDLELGAIVQRLQHTEIGDRVSIAFKPSGNFVVMYSPWDTETAKAVSSEIEVPSGRVLSTTEISNEEFARLSTDRNTRKCATAAPTDDGGPYDREQMLGFYGLPSGSFDKYPSWSADFGDLTFEFNGSDVMLRSGGNEPRRLGDGIAEANTIAVAGSGTRLLASRRPGGLARFDLNTMTVSTLPGEIGAIPDFGLIGEEQTDPTGRNEHPAAVYVLTRNNTLGVLDTATDTVSSIDLPVSGRTEAFAVSPKAEASAVIYSKGDKPVAYEVQLDTLKGRTVTETDPRIADWDEADEPGFWLHAYYLDDKLHFGLDPFTWGRTATAVAYAQQRLLSAMIEPHAGPGVNVWLKVSKFDDDPKDRGTMFQCWIEDCEIFASMITALTAHPSDPVTMIGNSIGQIGSVRFTDGNVEWQDLHAHNGHVRKIVYLAGGHVVASIGTDGRIRLWDADTGEPAGTLYLLGADTWAFITPQGVFDGSPQMERDLQFVWGPLSLPLEPSNAGQRRNELLRSRLNGTDGLRQPKIWAEQTEALLADVKRLMLEKQD